jgi:hypothetical protein
MHLRSYLVGHRGKDFTTLCGTEVELHSLEM